MTQPASARENDHGNEPSLRERLADWPDLVDEHPVIVRYRNEKGELWERTLFRFGELKRLVEGTS